MDWETGRQVLAEGECKICFHRYLPEKKEPRGGGGQNHKKQSDLIGRGKKLPQGHAVGVRKRGEKKKPSPVHIWEKIQVG